MKIEYLSDSMEEYRALEKCLANGDFGILHDRGMQKILSSDQARELMQQKFAELVPVYTHNATEQKTVYETLFPEAMVVPTRYDSPMQYLLLKRLIESIDATSRKTGLETDSISR